MFQIQLGLHLFGSDVTTEKICVPPIFCYFRRIEDGIVVIDEVKFTEYGFLFCLVGGLVALFLMMLGYFIGALIKRCWSEKAIGGRYHGGTLVDGGLKTHEQKRQEMMVYNLTHSVHQILDQADFEEQLKSAGSKLIVLEFFACCGTCKRIWPEFENLARAIMDVIFLKVDVDHLEEIAAEYNVSIIPTFFFILEGKQVAKISGSNAEKLKDFIVDINNLPRANLPETDDNSTTSPNDN